MGLWPKLRQRKLADALAGLRSKDSLTYDEAYHTLQGDFLSTNLDAVIAELRKELDPAIRGRLVEIVGDSRDARVIAILETELSHPAAEVRKWALHGLGCIDSPEAREVARLHLQQHPEDMPQ